MKILVLNGSPKGEKSITMELTQTFLDGAQFKADTEIIDVSKLEVKSCLGCYVCWTKTPGKCVIKDDMEEYLAKRIEADIIVWSFPLYCFNVPGGLKNFIDRGLPLKLPFMSPDDERGRHPSRYDLTHQSHIIISTCGFWTAEGNYDSITAMFNRIFGIGKYTNIFCPQSGIFGKPETKKIVEPYLETVRQAGAEYANGGICEATLAELAKPMLSRNVYEAAADASWDINDAEKDAPPDDSLKFTAQMAAFYVPDGNERVLEIHYTDIEKTYQVLMTPKGSEVITDGFKTYTTKIETPYSLWRAISRGEINGQDALFQKKYRVLGDFNLMMKFDELFGGTRPQKKTAATLVSQPQRKTDMKVLLTPWIVIWIAIAINPTVGAALGIISAAAVPLLWLKYRSAVYEYITVPVVAVISLAVLLGVNVRIVIPISYLCFGVMWLASIFTKMPLTAHYSYNDYGGEKLLENPLFIKVNRILTICWGCLYLIMAIAMYFLADTALLPYTGIISSAPPAIMGIFTVWFPRWYIARWARG